MVESMKINIAYDRLGEYNLSQLPAMDLPYLFNGRSIPLHDRFKVAPKWLEFDFDGVVEDTIDNFVNRQENFVYNLGTIGGPTYWLGGSDRLFDHLSTRLIEHAQKGKVYIHISQSMEGFPLNEVSTQYNKIKSFDAFRKLHDNLDHYRIPSNKLIFSTSNLIEQYNYNSWCSTNNVAESKRFHIVALPFFACATQHNKFFDWAENVLYQDHLNYKSTYPIKLFNCLNRMQRTHRAPFVAMLNYFGLVDSNIVSHNKLKQPLSVSNWPDHPAFKDPNFTSIKNKLPLTYDMEDFSVNYAQNFNKKIYLNTYLSVISESLYEDGNPTVFFSEKIFKPIRAYHPFIIICHKYGLHWLRKLGFKTFDKWWDESYDEEADPVKRMEMICTVLKKLEKLSAQDWYSLYNDMEEVLTHNYKHFIETDWWRGKYNAIII